MGWWQPTTILPRKTPVGEWQNGGFCNSQLFCVEIYANGGITMAVKAKIRMETISAIQKRLRKLPKKDDGKTRAEALEMLTADLQKALAKGYSLQELREIVREEGATLPLAKLGEQSGKEPADDMGGNEERAGRESASEPSTPAQEIDELLADEPTGKGRTIDEAPQGNREVGSRPIVQGNSQLIDGKGASPAKGQALVFKESDRRRGDSGRQAAVLETDMPDEDL
jgi:hypothetical protein